MSNKYEEFSKVNQQSQTTKQSHISNDIETKLNDFEKWFLELAFEHSKDDDSIGYLLREWFDLVNNKLHRIRMNLPLDLTTQMLSKQITKLKTERII